MTFIYISRALFGPWEIQRYLPPLMLGSRIDWRAQMSTCSDRSRGFDSLVTSVKNEILIYSMCALMHRTVTYELHSGYLAVRTVLCASVSPSLGAPASQSSCLKLGLPPHSALTFRACAWCEADCVKYFASHVLSRLVEPMRSWRSWIPSLQGAHNCWEDWVHTIPWLGHGISVSHEMWPQEPQHRRYRMDTVRAIVNLRWPVGLAGLELIIVTHLWHGRIGRNVYW